MRWIDEYLGETHSPATGGNVLMHLPGTSGSDPYYDQQQQNNNHVNGGGMNLVGKESRVGGGQRFTKRLLMQGGDVKPVVAGVGGAKKNNESTNGSPSSTSSEISVGSAQFGNGGTVQQQQQLHSQQGSQIMLPKLRHIPLSQGNDFGTRTHQLMYKMKQESAHEHLQQVAVAESAAGQHMGNYQIISIPPSQALHGPPAEESNNSNNYFSAATTSAVPTSAEAVGTHSPRRKRMALDTHQMQQPTGNGGAHQQRSGGGGGGSSRHLVIEPERIVLNQQQQMLPGAMLMHPPQQQQQQQVGTTPSTQIARSGSGLRLAAIGGARGSESAQQQIQSTSTAPPITAPQYILSTAQPQAVHYVDPEAGFVELIVRHLRNLNDDEKIVTKMNIQRILMDARFGRGACVRMFNDELAMEQQRQHVQQQQQQNSVNMRR